MARLDTDHLQTRTVFLAEAKMFASVHLSSAVWRAATAATMSLFRYYAHSSIMTLFSLGSHHEHHNEVAVYYTGGVA